MGAEPDARPVSGPFNVGSGRGTTIIDLLSANAKVVGKEPILEFQPPVIGDVQSNVLGCSKLRKATGWTPTVSLEDGLRCIGEWMKPQVSLQSNE
jgi:UDP-glucose 4-epimerase